MSARRLVAIVGATASGKTAAAIAAAERLPVEVLSADSRQIRAGMRIGTAAPTDAELAAVRHHLVGYVSPDAPYSLAEFLHDARAALEEIWSRGHLALLVGGSGQYVWALLEGWRPPAVPPDPALRAELESESAESLQARLRALDATAVEHIDVRNPRRLIRAIEVALHGGTARRASPPDFQWQTVGLSWPRAALHARSDARVEAMYDSGLIAETRSLLERYASDLPVFGTIGYAEALGVINGEWDLPTAIERTKIATHRLIRMQAAWFRADDPRIEWVSGDDRDAVVRAVEGAASARVR